MFDHLQRINPMGLSASLSDYKKQYFTNIKISLTLLRWNTKKSGNRLNGNFWPFGQPLYSQLKNYQNIDNKTKMNFCWKYLDQSQNSFGRLTQWDFVPLGPTLIHKTSNLNNLRNFLEANTFIDVNRWNHKNRHPHHDLTQTYRESKSICPVRIRPSENFKSHLRKCFSINEHWSNKYDTHKSSINKIMF